MIEAEDVSQSYMEDVPIFLDQCSCLVGTQTFWGIVYILNDKHFFGSRESGKLGTCLEVGREAYLLFSNIKYFVNVLQLSWE